MKRSTGVTTAAVVALVGSSLVGLLAIIGIIAALVVPRTNDAMRSLPQQGALPLMASMIMGALFEFGFAGCGLATGIGLIRLKPWSRISMLIYGGLLAVSGVFMALIFMVMPLPANPNAPQDFNFIFRLIMASFCGFLLFIAAWWLVLFTRKGVVAQFSGGAAAASPSGAGGATRHAVMPSERRPLTITIIAWLYLASVLMMIPSLLINQARGLPVPFLWTMLQGRGLWIYGAVFAPIMLIPGIALLKNKPWGFWLALGIQVFGLVSTALTVLLPGRAARWGMFSKYFQRSLPPELLQQAPNFAVTILTVGYAGGCLFAFAVSWLLWTRRKRFFDFAAMQAAAKANE